MIEKPDLNKPVFKLMPEKKALVEKGLCPLCEAKITEEEFVSELERKEYSISGMCKKCQDKMF